ncbi:ARM repeat-containing protein [Polyplosphaeria fusca]|uniref:Nucleolar protein 9 n=1 Tax=Polyplosphaeria fusca TaxID=682080 RepID=A0A9P4R2G2_9PLEO|nr:ARM repeat-containing protein [Polyplosphaeria fusca]
MPKENKKRGRRDEQKKRKRDHDDHDHGSKRVRQSVEDEPSAHDEQAAYLDAAFDGVTRPEALPFYGMLDESEQSYFSEADQLLESNQFSEPEERTLFLANVYKEASGKELKLANSQSCSRLMERLILLSTPEQLKGLFQAFSGHFLHLVQHRFASHCCEALFIHAAPIVTQELAKPVQPSADPNDIVVSMEQLFLYTLSEMEGYMGYLMTDRFASHVLRVLLVVLAGAPLTKQNSKSVTQSKRKEKITVAGAERTQGCVLEKRKVPESFLEALQKVIQESVSGLDATYLRALAMHPTGNPTLQLFLQLELEQFGKTRAKDETSVIRLLLPDDPITEGSGSASFINGLVYDTIGSRLLETIIQYAPAKMFKQIYRDFFKERMGSLSRNEIAGYVAGKIVERLGPEDLQEILPQIVDQIPSLVERNRTAILRTLIAQCYRRDVNTAPIKAQLELAYSGPNGFEVTRLLKLGEVPSEDGKSHPKQTFANPEQIHGSLLAQVMIEKPGPLANLVFDSLARLGTPLSLGVARDPTASRALQEALTSDQASVIFRRKVIQQFYGHIGELALDPSASHLIDAIWKGTEGLAFIRERIAEELAENEASLRESHVGRAVWRNWRMDLYKRRRADWVKASKFEASNDGFQPFPETANGHSSNNFKNGRHMTALELARQRYAAAKAEEAEKDMKVAKEAAKGAKREKQSTHPSTDKGKGKAPLVA